MSTTLLRVVSGTSGLASQRCNQRTSIRVATCTLVTIDRTELVVGDLLAGRLTQRRGHFTVGVSVLGKRSARRWVCVTTEPALGDHGGSVWSVGFADLIHIDIVGTPAELRIVASTCGVAACIRCPVGRNQCVTAIARVTSPNGSITKRRV